MFRFLKLAAVDESISSSLCRHESKQVVANVERHANVRPADVLIKLKEIYITTVKADRRCK